MRRALITGVTGQDGNYTADLLLQNGYLVYGTTRDISKAIQAVPDYLNKSIELYEWDMLDEAKLRLIIEKVQPTEIYNYASLSSGEKMMENPTDMGLINGLAVTKILSVIYALDRKIKFVQASSSEMFGKVSNIPQSEETPFKPQNPYGIAKLYAHQMVNFYRNQHNIFACSGILFNHESRLRADHFVTRKITRTAARIKLGLEKKLVLGNLDVKRDWIHAKDAVNALWFMLQLANASDYIVAGGKSRSVRDFCKTAFSYLGLNYENYVVSSPEFFRSIESINLEGNPSKLNALGWRPRISFEEMVHEMIDNDLRILKT
jgi:GDPmannose 4,6-dehydratase